MGKIFGREPALIMGLVQAGLALGLAFGVALTTVQLAAIMAFTAAVLSVIVRANVTPLANEI